MEWENLLELLAIFLATAGLFLQHRKQVLMWVSAPGIWDAVQCVKLEKNDLGNHRKFTICVHILALAKLSSSYDL